jgi:hypothetical protein
MFYVAYMHRYQQNGLHDHSSISIDDRSDLGRVSPCKVE